MTESVPTPNVWDAIGKRCNVYISWTDDGGVVIPGALVAFSERILDNGMYLVTLEVEQSPQRGA
jgi:hypothetical protein